MTDDEFLNRALVVLRDANECLQIIHQRHGGSPVFEDICCRVITGDVIHVLAEAERRGK